MPRKPTTRPDHPAERYARRVVAGEIVACKWVKLFCARHFKDLDTGAARGLHFDTAKGERILRFFKLLKHSKGEWAGKVFGLEDWQRFLLFVLFGWLKDDGMRRFRTAYIELSRKNGKSSLAAGVGLYLFLGDEEPGAEVYTVAPLSLDTPVPTPTGWTTMGQLQIGDMIFDAQGTPTAVTYLSPILYDRPCFAMRFHDGESIVCDASHQWTVRSTIGKSLKGRSQKEFVGKGESVRRTQVIRTTEQIREGLTTWGRRNFSVDVAGPLQLPVCQLPIPPYTLGVWLSDGSSYRGAISGHSNDKEISQYIEEDGYQVSWMKAPPGLVNFSVDVAGPLQLPVCQLPIPPYTLGVWLGDGSSYRGAISGHSNDKEISQYIEEDGYQVSWMKAPPGLVNFTVRGLRADLRRSGLITHDQLVSAKHVPKQYLRASRAQRLALLQGLMDTDGTCTKTGECRFTNRNHDIAAGVHELALSFGLRSNIRSISVTGRPHYVVSFRAPTRMHVFRLKRKHARQVPRVTPKSTRRYIISVDSVPSVPVRCISVAAASSLYLVGKGMIPTHNTKQDQAKIVWSEAARMVKGSPGFRKFVKQVKNNLSCERTNAKFEPLSSEDDTLDGLNVSGAIIDELHAHRTRGVWDVITTATGSRRQPIIFAITTAGYDRQSVCFQQHEYAEKVLEGIIEDDSFLGFVASLDVGDIWDDPACWIKSNPNLGVSVKRESMQEACVKAQQDPMSQNAFKRLRLNVWTNNETRWCTFEVWDQNVGVVDESLLEGRRCFGGLDLASTTDTAAFVLAFTPVDPDGPVILLPRFWVPSENMRLRVLRDRVPYDAWVRDGWMMATEGNVIDYDVIRAQILADYQRFEIQQIRYDRWGATQLSTQLAGDGIEMVTMGQGFASMSSPMKEFMRRLLDQTIAHGGHPVLRWQASNVMARMDPAGNIKPDKEASRERIDGIVAALMSLDGVIRSDSSTYETSGLKFLG